MDDDFNTVGAIATNAVANDINHYRREGDEEAAKSSASHQAGCVVLGLLQQAGSLLPGGPAVS